MTCYDLRFPELARALVDRGAECSSCPPPGWPGERKVDHWRTLVAGPGDREHRVRRGGRPARARATAATRWSSDPTGEVLAEVGDGDRRCCRADVDRARASTRRARTNPSLANRRL